MILTDKCKEEFLKSVYACNEWEVDEIYLNALIIEFFDSVGIYIWTMPSLRVETKWTYRVFKTIFTEDIKQHAYIYNSRSEATQSAITKANEIFNNLNK